MFKQLQQKYVATFDTKISQLDAALDNQDYQALFSMVHQLTGSSGSYGYTDIAELCSEIELLTQDCAGNERLIITKSQALIALMRLHRD